MRKLDLFFLIVVLILGACSTENQLDELSSTTSPISSKISIKEELEHADYVFETLNATTRGGHRTVSSIDYIEAKYNTRSVDTNDTLYYIINYGDNEGFAVLSANRDLGYIYAIGDEGHLFIKDSVENKGVAKFFRTLNDYIQFSSDSVTILPPPGVNLTDSLLKIKEYVSHKLPNTIQKWLGKRNEELYGKYAPPSISIAQVMAYFEKPTLWTSFWDTNKKRLLNWQTIKTYDICNLSSPKDLGVSAINNYIALVEESFSYSDYYQPEKKYFPGDIIKEIGEHFGYEIGQLYVPPIEPGGHIHSEPWISNASLWMDALRDGCLIICGDFHHGENLCSETITWVVDGFMRFRENSHQTLQKYDATTMFHCVWGQGGECNGYYAFQADGSNFIRDPIWLDNDELNDTPQNFETTLHYSFKPKE